MPSGITDTLENRGWPIYIFSTETIATTKNYQPKKESDLDLINVVPNPYYAYMIMKEISLITGSR